MSNICTGTSILDTRGSLCARKFELRLRAVAYAEIYKITMYLK